MKNNQTKNPIQFIKKYHYAIFGAAISVVCLYMIYTILSITSGTSSDVPLSQNSSTSLNFDTTTLNRIDELQYSKQTDNNAPVLPGRNPFQ